MKRCSSPWLIDQAAISQVRLSPFAEIVVWSILEQPTLFGFCYVSDVRLTTSLQGFVEDDPFGFAILVQRQQSIAGLEHRETDKHETGWMRP
jgi:hypothetical protein